jgi:hypothetical protein
MQEASLESPPDRLSAQPKSAQLPECHHAVLTRRELRNALTNRRWVISVSICGTSMTHQAKVTPEPSREGDLCDGCVTTGARGP